MDRKFLLTAFGWAIIGMALGIYMASTQQLVQVVTHAHILLIGFVVSFVYALCHKLWLPRPAPKLAQTQFYLHQIASLVIFVGLFLIYGRLAPDNVVGPILSLASLALLIGVVLMKIMLIQATRSPSAAATPPPSA